MFQTLNLFCARHNKRQSLRCNTRIAPSPHGAETIYGDDGHFGLLAIPTTTGISMLSIFFSRTALSCRLAKAAAEVATYPVTGPAMAYCIANARGIRCRRGLEKMAGQYYGQTLATVTLTLTCSATYKINKNEDTNFRSHFRNRQLGTAFRATDIL